MCNITPGGILNQNIKPLFPKTENLRALDLGCGTGATAFFLSQMGFDVFGVDISKSAIEKAKELALVLKLKIHFANL